MADLQEASANPRFRAHEIRNLKAGEDDGSFMFMYHYEAGNIPQTIKVEASVTGI